MNRQGFKLINPSEQLLGDILLKAHLAEAKAVKRASAIYSSLFVFSILALVLALVNIWSNLQVKDFFNYLSLFSSDGRIIASSLPDYISGLAENFPYVQISTCLLLLVSAFMALKSYYRVQGNAFKIRAMN